MSKYGLCYQLDKKAMKADGMSEDKMRTFYRKELAEALESCGLTKHEQEEEYRDALYITDDGEDALAELVEISSQLNELAPRFYKYVICFNFVRIEKWGHMTKHTVNVK